MSEGNKSCTWAADGGDTWQTTCRNYFDINDEETPEDCNMKFCCFCGKPLEQELLEDEP